MTEADRPAFMNAMRALCASYSREVDDPIVLAYWTALQDLPIAAVQAAFMDSIKMGGSFMAPAARVRQMAQRSIPAATPPDLLERAKRQKFIGTGDPNIDALRRGFRIWPYGSRAREVVKARLAGYGYAMPDSEYAAPRVELKLGIREEA